MLALASPPTLHGDVQRRLARYVHTGGRLLLYGVLPETDHEGRPCTVLAEALGLRPRDRVDEDHPRYFPSVVGHGFAAGRPEVRVGYAHLLDPGPGAPVLTEVGSGGVCGVEVTAGRGRALVIGCDYPGHLDFWRAALARLGVRPRWHDADAPGLVVTSTVDPIGQRLLHLLNVAPSGVATALAHWGEPLLGGRRIRVDARSGLMLPVGVRVGEETVIVGSTAELVGFDGGEVLLRPTQDEDVVVLDTSRTVTTDGGDAHVDGGRVSVTVPRRTAEDPPIRLILT